MENARLKYGGLSVLQQLLSWLLWSTIGYGYAPFWALWYIAGFVGLGAILFGWGHSAGVITPSGKDSPAQAAPFNPVIYSLENFLPLVDLHQAKQWLPDPNIRQPHPVTLFSGRFRCEYQSPPWLGRVLRWYLWVHILAGWFFSAMFIAGITGLVRRT